MKKISAKITFELVLIIFYVGIMYSQELEFFDDYESQDSTSVISVTITPTIKSPSAIEGLCWNNDGSSFAYVENNYVAVRKSTDYSMLSYIETDCDEIKNLGFAPSFAHRYDDRLITLLSDNKLEARVLPNKTPLVFSQGNSYKQSTCMAINGSGDYIACGDDLGSIDLYMWYHTINGFTKRQTLQSASSYIYHVDFSDDGKYLAAATDNDAIYFWDASSGETLTKIPYNSTSHLQIKFTKDSESIITGKDDRTIAVYDLQGIEKITFELKENIKSFEYLKKQNKVLVLTSRNMLRFFDLETGKETGFIEPVNQSKITSFSVNVSGKTILVGYEDGSLYVLLVKDVIQSDDPYAEGGVQRFFSKLNTKTGHGVLLNGGGIMFTNYADYWPWGVNVELGYLDYNVISPFYLGGMFKYYMGFPSEDFPYEFSTGIAPNLCGVTVYAPVGINIQPFKVKLHFFAEIRIGANFSTIWNGKMLNDSIITGIVTSFYAGFTAGVTFDKVVVSINAEYDSFAGRGFQLSADLGYYFDLEKKGKKK